MPPCGHSAHRDGEPAQRAAPRGAVAGGSGRTVTAKGVQCSLPLSLTAPFVTPNPLFLLQTQENTEHNLSCVIIKTLYSKALFFQNYCLYACFPLDTYHTSDHCPNKPDPFSNQWNILAISSLHQQFCQDPSRKRNLDSPFASGDIWGHLPSHVPSWKAQSRRNTDPDLSCTSMGSRQASSHQPLGTESTNQKQQKWH